MNIIFIYYIFVMAFDNNKVCCKFRKDHESDVLDEWEFNHLIKIKSFNEYNSR